uniref:hypothetical protein n=1 Tax=Okeania sp. SIO2F4 TaxID=2607790 RepID=UPI003415ABF0
MQSLARGLYVVFAKGSTGSVRRWRDGEIRRWGDSEIGGIRRLGGFGVSEKLKNIYYILTITMQDYPNSQLLTP